MESISALSSAKPAGGAAETREERLELLLAECSERAVRIAWRLVGGDAALAEDIAQDAFIRAHQGLGRFRGDAELGSWFYRIVVNEALRHHRRERTRKRVLAFMGADSGSEIEAEPRSDPPLQRRMADALGALTPGERAAVVLVHLEQFTVNETAEFLGKRPGTVKSQLHRGLRKLRASLADVWEATLS